MNVSHVIPANAGIQRVEVIAQMDDETTATIRSTAETAHQLEHIVQELQSQIGRSEV